MQEMERTREVMEQCDRYYIRNPDYTIQYEILISETKVNPCRYFGRYIYICSLWDVHENKKSELFPVFGNTRNEARQKIAKDFQCYLRIGGAK